MPLTRRSFLRIGAAAGAAAIALDAAVLEPNYPRLVQVPLPLKRLPESWDGLRIVQLSDFHYDEHFSVHPLRKAIEIVNQLKPDLIVLTGDFVTMPVFSAGIKKAAASIEGCTNLLRQLHASMGRFACLGNHDVVCAPARITNVLQAAGIKVLRNYSVPLERAGARLWLSGVDDVLEGNADLDMTLRDVPAAEPVILLAHEPDYAIRAMKYPVDLQLSGHTHGGQVRIPLLGAPVLPELGTKFPKGLYSLGPMMLYTNVGLGTIRIPVRLHCPPEITLFTLRVKH